MNSSSVFPFSEFSNPSDFKVLWSRWQLQSFDIHVHVTYSLKLFFSLRSWCRCHPRFPLYRHTAVIQRLSRSSFKIIILYITFSPSPLPLSLSKSPPTLVFHCAVVAFLATICEGWGGVDLWKHRVVQLAPNVLPSKHFFYAFLGHFPTNIFYSKFGCRMDEVCLKYQITQVLLSTFKVFFSKFKFYTHFGQDFKCPILSL